MNLIRWEPSFREFEDFFRQYSPALLSGTGRGNGSSVWRPTADISENDKEYLVKAELPGVKKEDIKISLQEGMLTISGERKLEDEQKDENQIRIERFYGSFSRSFALPENVDGNNVRAESKDGLLLVHIPKKQPSTPQPISIDVK